MEADPEALALESEMCRRDAAHWADRWVWTYDPRVTPATLPFNLFPRQREFLRWLAEREEGGEDGLVEKSRDMGITWLCCAYAVHGWLYKDGYAVGFGSRKLDLVDKLGDPDSIFEKMRFLIDYLPPWMRPRGYRRETHAGYCKIINPQNGSTITGEGGDQIGRGGRKRLMVIDEAAFLEHPTLIDRSLSQTTNCRIDVSTPNGPGNPFATKRFSGKVPVFIFDWRDDPRKNDEWYAKQKATKDAVTVAQEIDRDYSASIEGITIPAAWVRAAVNLRFPQSGHTVCGLDIAEEGSNRTVLIGRRGAVVLPPIDWGQLNTTQTAYRARDEAHKMGAAEVRYDVVGVGVGVKGTWQTSGNLPFKAVAINGGSAPSQTKWANGKTSAEMFANLRAEMWWLLRLRFEKVFEYVEKGVRHPVEEMISIPNHPQLITDLSAPLHHYTSAGKVQIEGKDAMRKRGVKSPDFGDALAMTCAPSTRMTVGTPR